MDRFTRDTLHLQPKSTEELHSVLSNFEVKWRHKAERAAQDGGRISRY